MAVFNSDTLRLLDSYEAEKEGLDNISSRNGGRNGGREQEGGERMEDGSEGSERTPDRIIPGDLNMQGPTVPGKDRTKRTVQDRSPQVEEVRQTRRRLNEFDMGEVFIKIGQTMTKRTAEVLARTPDGMKTHLAEGLDALARAVEEIMVAMSDGIKQDRLERDAADKVKEDRIGRLESKLQEVTNITGSLTNNNVKSRIRNSVIEMEKKVEEAGCAVKVLDIDVGKETDDRRDIVRRALDTVRGNAREDNQRWLDDVLRRTRVIVLGRKTTRRTVRDNRTEFSVPILFQCRDRRDAEDLDNILRGAGYYPSFHWPREIMDFLGAVKGEVRKQGFDERDYYFKIRPETRDGKVQIKVEVKQKEGNGRFSLKGVWGCPPLQRQLWDLMPDILQSRLVGRI